MTRSYHSKRLARVTALNATVVTFNPILKQRRKLNGTVTVTAGNAVEFGPSPSQPTRDAVNERIADYRRALRLCEANQCTCKCRVHHYGTAVCVHDCKHADCIGYFHAIARSTEWQRKSHLHGVCFHRATRDTVLMARAALNPNDAVVPSPLFAMPTPPQHVARNYSDPNIRGAQ